MLKLVSKHKKGKRACFIFVSYAFITIYIYIYIYTYGERDRERERERERERDALVVQWLSSSSNPGQCYLYFPYHSHPGDRYTSNYSPTSYRLIVRQNRLFNLGMATSLREGKLWFQTYLTPIKKNRPCLISCSSDGGEYIYIYI